jgi:hypothetical protein
MRSKSRRRAWRRNKQRLAIAIWRIDIDAKHGPRAFDQPLPKHDDIQLRFNDFGNWVIPQG